MTPISQHPRLSRTAGIPIGGKRTERLETSVSALTKQLCEEVAKRAGFPTIAAWQYSVITHIVHRKHSAIVRQGTSGVNENNPLNKVGNE